MLVFIYQKPLKLIMKTKILCLLFLMSISGIATAKDYTPAQLRKMISSGQYPKQGNPENKTQSMSFSACVSTITNMTDQVKDNYPVQTIVDSNIMKVIKIWTNDAAMVLSCSASDQKLIITTSKYL